MIPFSAACSRQDFYSPRTANEPSLRAHVIIVVDSGTAQIGRRRTGGATRSTAYDLRFQMIDSHNRSLPFCPLQGAVLFLLSGQKKMDGAGDASSITAIKLPHPKGVPCAVAGFRRRVAGCAGRGQRFAAKRQTRRKLSARRTGNDDRRPKAWRHCLPPLEKHPVDASGRAHGPTNGRDTTAAPWGGGE